jgi:hypothetical protein
MDGVVPGARVVRESGQEMPKDSLRVQDPSSNLLEKENP